MASPELRFGPSMTLSVGPWERPGLQGSGSICDFSSPPSGLSWGLDEIHR